jgi:hypothetical protein
VVKKIKKWAKVATTHHKEREVKGFGWKEKEIVGENIHVVGGCNNTLERRKGFGGCNNTSISRDYNSTLKSKASYEFAKCTNNQARSEQGAQGENSKTIHEVEVKCTSLACAFLEVRNKTFLQP